MPFLPRRAEFFEERSALHRDHGAGRKISETQMPLAEEHEQQAHHVEQRHGIDDAKDIACEQRAGRGHQALGREHADAGEPLAGRAAGHQRLEDQVVEEVDSRRRRGAREVPQRLPVGVYLEVEVAENQQGGDQQVHHRQAGADQQVDEEGERTRAGPGQHDVRVDARGARDADDWRGWNGRRSAHGRRRRVHAAPRCSSSASCSAWCSCCRASSSSSIRPCMMSPSL